MPGTSFPLRQEGAKEKLQIPLLQEGARGLQIPPPSGGG